MTDRQMSLAGGARPRPSRRATAVAVGAIAVAVLLVGGYWFFTDGPGWSIVSPRGSTVVTFSGDGDQVTASFRVREGWRIEWSSTGSRFAMGISGDENMGTVVQVEQPQDGLTGPPSKGTFHLDIKATGPWTAKILQGK